MVGGDGGPFTKGTGPKIKGGGASKGEIKGSGRRGTGGRLGEEIGWGGSGVGGGCLLSLL